MHIIRNNAHIIWKLTSAQDTERVIYKHTHAHVRTDTRHTRMRTYVHTNLSKRQYTIHAQLLNNSTSLDILLTLT